MFDCSQVGSAAPGLGLQPWEQRKREQSFVCLLSLEMLRVFLLHLEQAEMKTTTGAAEPEGRSGSFLLVLTEQIQTGRWHMLRTHIIFWRKVWNS